MSFAFVLLQVPVLVLLRVSGEELEYEKKNKRFLDLKLTPYLCCPSVDTTEFVAYSVHT